MPKTVTDKPERFLLSYDKVTQAHYLIPSRYWSHWSKWLRRNPASTTEQTTVYATRVDAIEAIDFTDPRPFVPARD